jgi:5'-nucleotidase
MRILVCNDDGFAAAGVHLLAKAAHVITPDVWVVAPGRKWTAASHQLSFDCDLTLIRTGERTYTCSGAPADCVVAAMTVLFAGGPKPDLVLAGINDKRNVAEDIAYSGTMAIAREATFWGVPAIAVSRAVPAAGAPAELDALRRLLQALWNGRNEWAADGHWLSINLPGLLPAPIAQARVGRDKIGGASDILANTPERIVYRIKRGRPGTSVPGDENAQIAAGRISVVRHRWYADVPVPDAVVTAWNNAVA